MFSLIKSGMATAMHELSVVSNNIANANSNGFKKTLVAFSELGDRFGSEQVDSAKVGLGASLGASRRSCLLYTSDADDDTTCVDLGGSRII